MMKPLSIILCCAVFFYTCTADTCYRNTMECRYGCGSWNNWGSWCNWGRYRNNHCGGYYRRYRSESFCCSGWAGSGCNDALCDEKTTPTACTLNEGYVKVSASGPVYTSSGGTCSLPNQCTDCNPGYYSAGSYCRACPEIANCYYTSCTSPTDRVCQYCKGVVKDENTKYGWWAYTRWIDGGLSCKQACSWREGSRCYPGSCSDTTVASCICSAGFEGKDCATITKKPEILGSFVQLKHVTENSVELVEAPPDVSAPSPQGVIFTNNVHLDTAEAYVDSQFVYDLPSTPPYFYVKHESSRVGIVDGGVSLTLVRGSSNVSHVSRTCPVDPPVPNNYRCNDTFSLKDSWTDHLPFTHEDRVQFQTYTTNGGYITVYDRENNDNEVRYNFQGATQRYTFEIGIDTEDPRHCKLSRDCDDSPLSVTDVSVVPTVAVKWQGWYDDLAGIDSYHFELFHLRSTGPQDTDKLTHGDKVIGAIDKNLPNNIADTTMVVPNPGPYSLTVSAFDRAGNHKTARQVFIFDDQSAVDKQGSRTVKAGPGGVCTWDSEPAAPIILNANPDANCDWIVQSGKVQVAWKDYFINTRHYAGQWLNGIAPLHHVDDLLDDQEGKRQVQNVDNVLAIVDFKISYEILGGQTITTGSFDVTDLYKQSATIEEDLEDGLGMNITVSAFDITGAYANESVFVKVDSTPPVIDDLWLTVGNMKNVSVHSVEDLSKITIEWTAYDYIGGIHSIMWRMYDNFTGADFDHGSAYESPQGNTMTMEECKAEYGSYPRGAECYCTPFDGCYHSHFQVKPNIDIDGTNGIPSDRHIGNHDHDYFIEVTATNRAMLTLTQVYKITVDTSPPTPGTVHEGISGNREVDFQQDSEVHVHWKDFFDKESGVLFYDYNYGPRCHDSGIFTVDINDNDQRVRTYDDFAMITVPSDGTYFVTVVAFNRALDHSIPVCSDGITIDSKQSTVSRVTVVGAKTAEGPLKSDNDEIWFLHEDRTIQRVSASSDSCIQKATHISPPQLLLYKLKHDSQGRVVPLKFLNCDPYPDRQRDEIVSYISVPERFDVSWVTNDSVPMFNTEIGVASYNSDEPDVVAFESTFLHKNTHIETLNLMDGEIIDILIKTTTKSGVLNTQRIGPLVVDTSPPSIQGEITSSLSEDADTLVVRWVENTFFDNHQTESLHFEFAVGSEPLGTNVHAFQELKHNENCPLTDKPTCTVIVLESLEWRIPDSHMFYVTIKATNRAGLSITGVSKPFTHISRKPARGVVFDIEGNNLDADYQQSRTKLQGKWFGFETPPLDVNYTICQAENDIILHNTCKYVKHNGTGILNGLNLKYFTVYQLAVVACSPGGCTSAVSDGIMPVDTSLDLSDVMLNDGPNCRGNTDLMPDKFSHHDTVFTLSCSTDIEYQYSANVLNVNWNVPEIHTLYIRDVLWVVQQRAPVADHWENVTEVSHSYTSSSGAMYSGILESGRSYRFWLRFCSDKICFPSLHSSGVTVIHYPPQAGAIDVRYEQTADGSKFKITLDGFKDSDIESSREAREVMDHYEWAVHDRHGGIVNQWTAATDVSPLDERQVYFEVLLAESVNSNKCWRVSVRGHNKVGLHTTTTTDIRDCNDAFKVKESTVIDVVGPGLYSNDGSILGDEIHISDSTWEEDDKDYTPYDNILSAVWPKLRYLRYTYAVIEKPVIDSILFHEESFSADFHSLCDDPNTILCGSTDKHYINVHHTLVNGNRYAICVHGDATVRRYEKWDEDLPDLTVCSDGVTVDTTPPSLGQVYINGQGVIYQQSLTEILVIWENFVDIEELGNAVHSTGVRHYEVALGTQKGERDVLDWIDVNITNHFIIHGLNLQKGHAYYAAVKGTDFTGKFSIGYSPPVTPDNTPPIVSNAPIRTGQRYITNRAPVNVCWWTSLYDPESGMEYYEYGIGSRPGYDDILTFTKTTDECADVNVETITEMEEGHDYVISIKGFNGAGLDDMASSWSFVVDYSPPVVGYVLDGPDGTDIDYQTEKHSLAAVWSGFHDAHTDVVEYYVEIGTQQTSQDIIEKHSVGVKEEIVFDDLHLIEGEKYYVIVTACNAAELCSSAISDGIMIDSTPPVPGIVIDGSGVDDIDYQSSRNTMSSRWIGFVDVQSDISHYLWRLGTAPGADDVIAAQNVHLVDDIVLPDIKTITGHMLPEGRRLYVTVKAFNRAGLYSESTSNGVTIDTTPPRFASSLKQLSIGSLSVSTSVLRDMLKVEWKVDDDESFIDRQYLSIVSHIGEDFNVTVQIPGLGRDYTFTDITLSDGSRYDVILWSCNHAQMCSKSSITGLLVDSTPPIAGTFALHTDHSANLHGHVERMSWSQNMIGVPLVGFSDEHSGISHYHINVGSSYMGSDLHSADTVLPHDDDSSIFSDGGKVQLFRISTQDLSQYQHVFLTVWAQNGVGLVSKTIHSQFKLIPGGDMELIRRCEPYSCQGHCVCAADDKKCPTDSNTQPCVDVTADLSYARVKVKDSLNPVVKDVDISCSPTNTMLAALWDITEAGKIQPKWYEWSAGLTEESEPQGIFITTDRVWHDAAQLTNVVFTLDAGESLHEKERYSVFVRAWYSGTHYATFKSSGVDIQSKKPQTSNLFGKSVKEVLNNSRIDVDFCNETELLYIDWAGVFKDNPKTLAKYDVYIANTPGGHSSFGFYDVSAQSTQVEFKPSAIALLPGVQYYSMIKACTLSGLHTTAISDGFVIDMDTPRNGVILDGTGLFDLKYQNQSDLISARWYGFVDGHSYIRSYTWCVSTAGHQGSCDVIPPTNVGMETNVEIQLPSGIPNGKKVINEVSATDSVGHTSTKVYSNGVVIDTTPPAAFHLEEHGDNILRNPSFEQNTGTNYLNSFKLQESCNAGPIASWDFKGCALVLKGSSVEDGHNAVWVRGNISQTLSAVSKGRTYSVQFYVSHAPSTSRGASAEETLVRLGEDQHVFQIYPRPGHTQSDTTRVWQKISCTFVPQQDDVLFTVGTMARSEGILVDNIKLKEMAEVSDDPYHHVKVHAVMLHDWASVHASWKCEDHESGIREYVLAVGTVLGGTQLQRFKSVGKREFETLTIADLPDRTALYVTVMVTNGAGLSTVLYSDALLIDKSPPFISEVNDGPIKGQDVDFQAGKDIAFSFDVQDLESGIKECLWAIGTAGDFNSINHFTTLPEGVYTGHTVIVDSVDISRPIYVTVRCVNNAGLTNERRSDGVQILSPTPDTSSVVLDIIGGSGTQYPAQDYFHGRTDGLSLRWSGFQSTDAIQYYKVQLVGDETTTSFEVLDSGSAYTTLNVDDYLTEPGHYNCLLTGINRLGVSSETVTQNITIITDPPTVIATTSISMVRDSGTETVIVNWKGVFHSTFPLYYEVSVGTKDNSADILQWRETDSTTLKFVLPTESLGEFGDDIFVVVSAISPSGSYATVSVSQWIV